MSNIAIWTAKIKWDGTIPSVNQLYLPRAWGRKVWTYINPEAVKFKEKVKKELMSKWSVEEFEKYKDQDICINLNISFVFSHKFWQRDVSNLIKATEDAIVNATGLDDKYNLNLDIKKVLNDVDDSEYIMIVYAIAPLGESTYRWSQYQHA